MTDMALSPLLASFAGTSPPDWLRAAIDSGLGGVVLFGSNVVDDEQVADLVALLRGRRSDLVVAIDEEGGDVTRLDHLLGSDLPGNAALGVVDDTQLTYDVHLGLGRRLHGVGIDLDFAPSADVNSASDNPIIGTRSFGSDPGLVARHTAAAVRGLQDAGVAACAKHFPGHGSTVTDSHLGLAVVEGNAQQWRHRDLVPFAAAVDADTAAVMTAHVQVPWLTGDQPSTFSAEVLVDVLRGELGFGGVVVTDALDMRGASGVIGIPEAAVRSLRAGSDLLCIGSAIDAALLAAIGSAVDVGLREGRLQPEAVAASRARVAALSDRPAVCVAASAVDGTASVAAQRAIRWAGEPRRVHAAYVVELDSTQSIAAGPVPWGLGPVLAPGRARVQRAGPGTDGAAVVAAAGADDLVIVLRDAHRNAWMRHLVSDVRRARPDAVVVEMGVPHWFPGGAHLLTYGSGRGSATAALTQLLG